MCLCVLHSGCRFNRSYLCEVIAMKKIISLIKSCWHKALCSLCALAVICISVFASVPAHATSSSWEDLGEDAVALKDAYLRYLNGWGNGSLCDIIGGAVDVPISWYKTLSDGVKAISPVDDWAYYLTEEDQTSGGGGHIRTGDSSSHASDRPSSEVSPVLPAETLKQAASYWADYYKPMPTTTQYTWSYQTVDGTKVDNHGQMPYTFKPYPPIYKYTSGNWGGKDWDSVYLLLFYKDDDVSDIYYGKYYYHFYSTRVDDVAYLNIDEYTLLGNSLYYSSSIEWKSSYPYIALSGFNYLYYYKNLSDFYSDNLSNCSYASPGLSYDMLSGSLNSLVSVSLKSLNNSSTFTPNTDKNDDWGFYLSSEPFETISDQTSIDFDQIPDNYTITINGDTIYDYSITNPDTGDTSSINEYVTNNYTYITNNNGGDSGSGSGSSGSVSGNVDVSGSVVVGGQLDIKADPIDINVNTQPIDINVNVSSGGNSGGSYTGEAVDISGYLDNLPEQSETMNDYFSVFFSFVPPEFLALLISGISIAILMRVLGR